MLHPTTPALLLVSVAVALAAIGPDGNCTIDLFVPFRTYDSSHPFLGITGDLRTNVGFSQLGAALLATKHFNDRNATVVPQIAEISHDCNITINIGRAFNAVPRDWNAMRTLQTDGFPDCAMVGPYDDSTATDLDVLAQANFLPLVTTRSFDAIIVSDFYSQFTSSVYPDLLWSGEQIANFLVHKGRDNYVAFVYDLTPQNMQRREVLGIQFDHRHIRWTSHTFGDVDDPGIQHQIHKAMEQIKKSGYRTIIIAQSDPFGSTGFIAAAAEELGMNNGDYFYMWYDDAFEPALGVLGDKNISKLTAGSAWILAPSQDQILFDEDPFTIAWKEQGEDMVNALNALNPIDKDEVGFVNATPGFFQQVPIESGAAQMYDAILSVGFGACNAQGLAATGNGEISGSLHQIGIRNVSFFGATGKMEFGDNEFVRGGSRQSSTVFWAAVNLVSEELGFFRISDEADPDNGGTWTDLVPFVYADGTTSPPLLRTTPEQNYLSSGLRAMGFALMGLTMLGAVVSAVWVFVRRKHKILAASQPFFLYMICLGAIVMVSAILPSSLDESHGWSVEQLDKACVATPWLLSLGYILVYAALFTKLWRVNKVLQFTRRKIEIRHVALPMAILVVCALAVLVVWTVVDPPRWVRTETDSVTGESIADCESENTFLFVGPLVVMMLIPTFLTAYMAHKTKDVDDAYTESWWIFILIVVQIEVLIVAIPLIVILREESADGRYIGFIFLLWSFPTTAVGLIFIPKMIAYRSAVRGESDKAKFKRGTRGDSRVSGVSEDSNRSPIDRYSTSRQSTSRPPARSSVLSDVEEERSAQIAAEANPPVVQSRSASAEEMFHDEQSNKHISQNQIEQHPLATEGAEKPDVLQRAGENAEYAAESPHSTGPDPPEPGTATAFVDNGTSGPTS